MNWMYCLRGTFASLYDKIYVVANVLDLIEIVLVNLALIFFE